MQPKVKALGIILKGNEVLLEEQIRKHSQGDGLFYRPLGGTIEFGESSKAALIREFQEEIAVTITIQAYLGCIENIFRIEDQTGHEIIQLYLATFEDPGLLQQNTFEVREVAKRTQAKWVPLNDLLDGQLTVYPTGLKELLKKFQPR